MAHRAALVLAGPGAEQLVEVKGGAIRHGSVACRGLAGCGAGQGALLAPLWGATLGAPGPLRRARRGHGQERGPTCAHPCASARSTVSTAPNEATCQPTPAARRSVKASRRSTAG